MHNKFYADYLKEYDENEYFNQKEITIYYSDKDINREGKENRGYYVTKVEMHNRQPSLEYAHLEKRISQLNELILANQDQRYWQMFYILKEIIQELTNDELEFNYFRGQPVSSSLLPGILRNDVSFSYQMNFEGLYKKIFNEFPDRVTYEALESNIDSINKRAYQLSLLQHYGLKTSLLDITSNPYIAMLFMFPDAFDKYQEPTLYLFRINEDNKENNLFSEVQKNQLNERIIVQKGAFLNFDKRKLFKPNDFEFFEDMREISRIDVIKISLVYDNEISDVAHSDIFTFDIEKESDLAENYDKVSCLNNVKSDILLKLKEYHYFREDLFPDFEQRIQFLSKKYESNTMKRFSTDISQQI